MSALIATDVQRASCGCGCGEITNARQIEAWRLRAEGKKNVEIAEMWGMHPGSIKSLLHREPSRFLQGHQAKVRLGPDAVAWTCERCGGSGLASATREEVPRFCQRRECLASVLPIWRSIGRSVGERRKRREDALERLFSDRTGRLMAADQRRAARAERDAADRIDRAERRRIAREEVRAALELMRRDNAERREQARADKERRRLSFRRYVEEKREALQALNDEAVLAWLEDQSPEVQEFVRTVADPRPSWKSLDAVFSAATTGSLHDVIPGGPTMNPRDVEWFDPVGDLDFHQIDLTQLSIAETQALIRDLPVIPGDWLRRLRDGEVKLVIDGDSVAFVRHAPNSDAVPWRDAPGPIPTTMTLSGGINHGFGSSMKQKQKVARGGGHRTSRKAKATR